MTEIRGVRGDGAEVAAAEQRASVAEVRGPQGITLARQGDALRPLTSPISTAIVFLENDDQA
ncbi:hypothetical protein AB0F17_43815 [Nonomuraea sp. NPDC026600]|uniref:hypothetical protein n=1 Tax=Nonomuraea sp. NPDC026600 TaxID=3155363 RepID=UPI0033C1C2C5